MLVSIVIPVYNEGKTIQACLKSLLEQSLSDFEIVVVDDGSRDDSFSVIEKVIQQTKIKPVRLLRQKHLGSGAARNRGAAEAKGEILVFVDADMTFEKTFIVQLITPITKQETPGTFTREEFVSNWENVWSRCWNYYNGLFSPRKLPLNYPLVAPVFRAIKKSEFIHVGGFDNIGFTDDWTLSRKLGYQATAAPRAVCYHANPDTLNEVYQQARWIGKNEFMTGSIFKKLSKLFKHNPVGETLRALLVFGHSREPAIFVFAWIYGTGITVSILMSFLGEEKSK